jgi:hypothetical protein
MCVCVCVCVYIYIHVIIFIININATTEDIHCLFLSCYVPNLGRFLARVIHFMYYCMWVNYIIAP